MVLREHGVALETDLGIMKLNAALITDERLEAWVSAAIDETEKEARKNRLNRLVEKTVGVEDAMAELREGMAGDADDFL